MTSDIKVTQAAHNLGENTQAFKTNDVNEIYFTVSKNNWSDRPRGTFMVYAGAYEHSNMLKDHIEKLTDEGFDVVTVDMPGVGQSYRHAEVGKLELNHMESYDERVQAARTVMQYYEDNFNNGQEAQFHALTSGNGSVDFLKTLTKTEAGTTRSVTMVNPHFDVDLNNLGQDTYTFPIFDADAKRNLNSNREIGNFVGPHVLSQFQAASGKNGTPPATTRGYFNTYAEGVSDIQNNSKPYVDALKRNDVRVSVIHDGENDSAPNSSKFNDEEFTVEWLKNNHVDGHPVNLEGAGSGLLYDPQNIDAVLNNAVLNAEHAAPRARIIGLIKNIDDHEWKTSLSESQIKELQQTLEDKGFSVGPTGVDGDIRFASISYTEHALADFIMEAEKQGKVNFSDIKNADVTPQNLLDFVKNTVLDAPQSPIVENAPSLPAFTN